MTIDTLKCNYNVIKGFIGSILMHQSSLFCRLSYWCASAEATATSSSAPSGSRPSPWSSPLSSSTSRQVNNTCFVIGKLCNGNFFEWMFLPPYKTPFQHLINYNKKASHCRSLLMLRRKYVQYVQQMKYMWVKREKMIWQSDGYLMIVYMSAGICYSVIYCIVRRHQKVS